MEAVRTLLSRAEKAGLLIREDHGLLVINGPKRLEPIAKAVLARKAEVLPFVTGRVIPTENQCGQCLGWRLSRRVDLDGGQRVYLCARCFAAHAQA